MPFLSDQSLLNEEIDAERQDKEQLEINKRILKNEKEITKIFRAIFQKSHEQLTDYDKAFLRARASYLTNGQRQEYADVLEAEPQEPKGNNPDANKDRELIDYSRNQLNDMARDLGVEKPEEMKSKQQVIDAITEAKKNQ